jgi:glycosyltransferase involved in cell wall biosynthesis
MDILILNWKDNKNPDVGGAEIILYEFAKRWIKEGHTVTWFCRSFKGADTFDNFDGIQIVRRGNRISTYIHSYFYYKSLLKKPDIVIDVLNTVFWQTPLFVEKSKRIAYVNQLAKEVFWHELPPIISHLAYLFEKIQFLTYRNTSFITYAQSTKSDLIREGIQERNIKVFSLGLDHSRYKPGKKAEFPLFLCVSRLVKMKRTDLAIKAMKIVSKKYPNAKLAVVGYGYQRKALGALRTKLHLESTVFFIDEDISFHKIDRKDKKVNLMQQAWALIFPSVKEGWGMTVTECAACGTPAIVTNVTGLQDSVQDGKTGIILSKSPNENELADAMISLIENEKLRVNLSQNAQTFSKTFSWDKSAKEVMSLLKAHINGQ